jgi:hypothetical protein
MTFVALLFLRVLRVKAFAELKAAGRQSTSRQDTTND